MCIFHTKQSQSSTESGRPSVENDSHADERSIESGVGLLSRHALHDASVARRSNFESIFNS